MSKIKLLPHQIEAMEKTKGQNKVAYYLDMGLGKTFVGSEKAWSFDNPILVVCQKSKVEDWVDHFKTYYTDDVQDCTKKKVDWDADVLVINYDIVWRRPQLLERDAFTLILDESSNVKNEKANRTKIFIGAKRPKVIPIDFENVILLSGTPTGGKYEELVTQSNLIGWDISKDEFWSLFIKFFNMDQGGYAIPIVKGYKNVGILKKRLREYGAVFMKTEEVTTLPKQNYVDHKIKNTKAYKKFLKDLVLTVNGKELLGETMLTELLYSRQLASSYNENKFKYFIDLVDGTYSRVIVFYSFKDEFEVIKKAAKKLKRKLSYVNGDGRDLKNYEKVDDSITAIQYQSGSMGLNLQLANQMVYYSPPLSSEHYEQSKKRIHRIGQDKPCFYHRLITEDSVEEKIYKVLETRNNYTQELFRGR